MAVIVDTELSKHEVEMNVFKAFLYGIIDGEYTMYENLSTKQLSIKFEDEEDATIFTLKDLGAVFKKKFNGRSDNPFRSLSTMEDIFKTTYATNHSQLFGNQYTNLCNETFLK